VFGSLAGQERLSAIVREVLSAPRDAAILQQDVLAMRSEISAHKIPAGPLDVKLLRGGLVDCEFIVHFLQLRHRIAFRPALGEAIAELVTASHLPPAFGERFALLARLLVAARLLAPDGGYPSEAAQAVLARACGQPDFAALVRAVHEARAKVAECWGDVFGERLEIDEQ
jgi:glutamate-ammonia-ligase adenylyltransferase